MKLWKIGGIASLVDTLLAVLFVAIIFVMFPHLGLTGPNDWGDPAKGIPAWKTSAITFYWLNVEYVLGAIAALLAVLALRERLQAAAPVVTQLALIGASIACGLWIAGGLVGIVGIPPAISADDASAYRATMGTIAGLGSAADHSMGWTLLLMGWIALKTANLPRTLCYLMMVAGVVYILAFLSLVLALVGLAIFGICMLYVGIVLLKAGSGSNRTYVTANA